MQNDDPDPHAEPVAVGSYATVGEAGVAVATLRAFGIEAALDDHIEGGALDVDGELGVIVAVHASDAADARSILSPDVDDHSGAEPDGQS